MAIFFERFSLLGRGVNLWRTFFERFSLLNGYRIERSSDNHFVEHWWEEGLIKFPLLYFQVLALKVCLFENYAMI